MNSDMNINMINNMNNNINDMNNNMNNMNNQFPMRGIQNFSGFNFSYLHSVLQSLSCLDTAKQFLNINNSNNMINFPQFALTKGFYDVINVLQCGGEAVSSNIIELFKMSYNKNALNMKSNNVLSNDPYHFLHYSLEFLHLENNVALNPNFNMQILYSQNLQNQQDDNYMFCLFLSFFKQTQNSLISNYFVNIERYTNKCINCGLTYSYGMKKIFRINVDSVKFFRDMSFPFKAGSKITLDDCFLCYCGGNKFPCKFCNNQNAYRYTKLCCSAKVLMIYLERNNHCFYGDVEIKNQFNISNYYSMTRTSSINYNPNYILKACISYCDTGKYFADCYVKKNNMLGGGFWYRFMDNQVKLLTNPEIDINEYEPQLLLYELDDFYYNNNLIFNPFRMNHNNSNNMTLFINFIDNLITNSQFLMYRNMMAFIQQNQTVENAQIQNRNIMKYMVENDPGYYQFNKDVNPIQNQVTNFQLRFSIVPEIGDQSFEKNMKIFAQVRNDSTIKFAVDNFYKKSLKKKEAITKFVFEGIVLDPNSEATLESMHINEDTIIKAIKAPNFDKLDLIST